MCWVWKPSVWWINSSSNYPPPPPVRDIILDWSSNCENDTLIYNRQASPVCEAVKATSLQSITYKNGWWLFTKLLASLEEIDKWHTLHTFEKTASPVQIIEIPNKHSSHRFLINTKWNNNQLFTPTLKPDHLIVIKVNKPINIQKEDLSSPPQPRPFRQAIWNLFSFILFWFEWVFRTMWVGGSDNSIVR